ncbi:MAG: BRO-N domain-containing protein, partial [Geminicoccaceae bacterium]
MTHITNALRDLDDDELNVQIVQSGPQTRRMRLISEPGFYKLVGRSRKPAAKRFDRWVRHEVLPTIRKTGGYQAQPKTADRFDQLAGMFNKLTDVLALPVSKLEASEKLSRPRIPKKDLWTPTTLEWANARSEPFRLIEMFPGIADKHGSMTGVRHQSHEPARCPHSAREWV